METTEACVQLDLDEVKFELIQGAIVMDRRAVGFWGGRGVQHLFLGSGRCFDLTCGVGGTDRLFLQGSSADHQVRVGGDLLTLRHALHGTEIKVHAGRGPRELAFDDGTVLLGTLWRSALQTSALLGVVGEASACALATVACHTNAMPRLALGALPEGALLQIEGLSGVETVYAGHSQLRVQLDGRLAEHKARRIGKALVLSRRSGGTLETAYVVGPSQLVFSDGSVSSAALSVAVQCNGPWPVPQGDVLPALPRITAVALDVDSMDFDWSEDAPGEIPSGLFGGCRVGQVFEASVSLEEAVKVDGTPRLHLCVGGRHRAAQFSGGSGTATLRFVYTVTEDDVAQATGNETKGLTLTGHGNLDVEVGPVLTAGASIRALQTSPLTNDAQVPALSLTELNESGWQALNDESERRVAVALARLDSEDVVTSGRMNDALLDLELDLILDVDLADLETHANELPGYRRQPLPQLA